MKNPQKEIDWAIGIAEKLPEKFQQTAFAELLRYALLYSDNSEPPNKQLPKKSIHQITKETDFKNFSDLDLLSKKGNRDQHIAWAVAELYARNEEVNNNSIRKIIREHLAITPPARQNANRSLRNLTPKYITRTKNGRKYNYTPTEIFIDIFNDLGEEE